MVTSFQPTKDVEIIDKMPDSVREALDLILSNSIGSSNYTQGIETLSQLSETNDSYALYELGKMNEVFTISLIFSSGDLSNAIFHVV